jgi:hypothetical protein
MVKLDRKFLEQLLEMSSEDRMAYLKTLTPADRKQTEDAAWKLHGELLAQEMAENLNANVTKTKTARK